MPRQHIAVTPVCSGDTNENVNTELAPCADLVMSDETNSKDMVSRFACFSIDLQFVYEINKQAPKALNKKMELLLLLQKYITYH